MNKKLYFLGILISFLLSCNTNQTKNNVSSIEIDISEVIEKDFIGIGVQVSAYPWYDLSDSDWEKVFSRISYMKMRFTRIMIDMTDFFAGLDENGLPQYIFQSKKMLKLYTLLDYCEEKNIKVILGQWGAANTAKFKDGQNWKIPLESKMHASISVDFIDHIVTTKNYSCIKWFNLINEPNGSWSSLNGNFELWKSMIFNLHTEMKRRGLTEKITIAGPDNSGGNWHKLALQDEQLLKVIDLYDCHLYARNGQDILSENLEKTTKENVELIANQNQGKKYVLGELGILDGKNKNDQQLNVKKYWYGVSMADAAIQLIRGGAAGFLAWNLDDALHYNGDSDGPLEASETAYENRKIWGMWNIVGAEHGQPEEEQLRPWFYPWSLLSRNFPKGCQTLYVSTSNLSGVRMAAARIPVEEANYYLSVTVVNNSDSMRNINLVIPGIKNQMDIAKYNYADINKDNKVDSWDKVENEAGEDIFPSPQHIIRNADLVSGIPIELAPKSLVILTTVDTKATFSVRGK